MSESVLSYRSRVVREDERVGGAQTLTASSRTRPSWSMSTSSDHHDSLEVRQCDTDRSRPSYGLNHLGIQPTNEHWPVRADRSKWTTVRPSILLRGRFVLSEASKKPASGSFMPSNSCNSARRDVTYLSSVVVLAVNSK